MRSLTFGVALGSAAVLVLQGCGGGGSDGPPTTTTTTTTSTLVPDAPGGLYWCEELSTFYKLHFGDDGQESASGQCQPAHVPGAFYTKPGEKDGDGKSDRPWECFSPDFSPDLRTNKEALKQNYQGACVFRDFNNPTKPEDVDDCSKHLDHHPSVCAPGPGANWGACWSFHSENWRCIPWGDSNIPDLAAGDCKAGVVLETASSTPTKYFFDGVCKFGKDTTPEYKCDTVPNYDKSSSASCGQDIDTQTDKACFSTKAGVQWGCFAGGTPFSSTPCDWTIQPDGTNTFYKAACLFDRNANYSKALPYNSTVASNVVV